jgi:tetratricopeptide (TPR) repeat protein
MSNLFCLAAALVSAVWLQGTDTFRAFDRSRITIIDAGKPVNIRPTFFEAGPEVGRVLNNHYFPAISFYNAGRYTDAEGNLTYLLDRPDYINGNPRKPEFMSAAFYLRGMIYLYHASGIGRHGLARNDFEAAINWNPGNHPAHLELSRIYSKLGFNTQAVRVLKQLLDMSPGREIAAEAQSELRRLSGN